MAHGEWVLRPGQMAGKRPVPSIEKWATYRVSKPMTLGDRGSRFGAIGYLAFLAFSSACFIGAPQAPAQAQTIVTLGGGFSLPAGVAVDGSGNVFVADERNNAVKEIPASCIAGVNNVSCVKTLGGGFSQPVGVAVDGSGNVFVADFLNKAVKEIPASCIAGVNNASCVETLGGGFSQPNGVAVDVSGNVFVGDNGDSAVKEIPASCIAGANNAGCVETLGGGFNFPVGVAVDGGGNVFVADTSNSAVKEIPASCIAGVNNASCVETLGGFIFPSGVAVDGSGNVFVADFAIGAVAVMEIPASCIAGANNAGCVETLGGGFSDQQGVAVDGGGNVFVADSGNNAVKEILGPFLTVIETGLGSGSVTSTPAGIACGPTCSYTFGFGTTVTLTASAAAGSVFSGWTDSTCSSFATNPCTLTLAADTTVTANFARIPSYMLSVSLAGTGSGTVASMPSGINCGSMCSASFLSGTQVSLTATASANSTFAGWGGACSGAGSAVSCMVTMSGVKSVSASFTLNASPLTAGNKCKAPNGTFNGAVTVSAGQNCTFVAGSEIAGTVTVNGGSFTTAGTVTRNLAVNAGSLVLQPTAVVTGNVQISGMSGFSLAAGAMIGGNLAIQQVAAGQSPETVCGTAIKGNFQVDNNLSPIEIGANNSCAGNTVGGNLEADNNSAALAIDGNIVGKNAQVQNNSPTVDVSRNKVAKNLTCSGNTQVTHVALNMVSGQNQGQCAAFP